MQEPILIAAGAVGLVVLVFCLGIVLGRRSSGTAVALARELAVEREKSSRITGLEAGLAERTEAAQQAELALATAREGLARLEVAVTDIRDRLAGMTAARDDALARLETIRAEKGAAEGALAEKSASVETLRSHHENTLKDLDGERRMVEALRAELATLNEKLTQERRQAGEKLALLTEARERMTQEFKLLAGEMMRLHGEAFSKQNQEQIGALLNPMREKLVEFQQGLQQASTESTKERATLAEQIRLLSESSAKMTTETLNLTRALKGETQTQGAWGEMILGSILEKSGLRVGEEYEVQQTHADQDGLRLRPDVIVNLPGNQKLVIDAKVSLVAFDAHIAAETEAERDRHGDRHLASIRTHIRTLSSKDYHAAAGSGLDYVIMFVPIEGALALALQRDPGLTGFAVENNVAIATPTTLMIALRTVANIWQVERRNRNAEKIAIRAGRIYDKLAIFIGDMLAVGNRLGQAQTSYNDAMGKLSSGRGNLVTQVSQLKDLGARASKSIPASLIDETDADEADPDEETTEAA